MFSPREPAREIRRANMGPGAAAPALSMAFNVAPPTKLRLGIAIVSVGDVFGLLVSQAN